MCDNLGCRRCPRLSIYLDRTELDFVDCLRDAFRGADHTDCLLVLVRLTQDGWSTIAALCERIGAGVTQAELRALVDLLVDKGLLWKKQLAPGSEWFYRLDHVISHRVAGTSCWRWPRPHTSLDEDPVLWQCGYVGICVGQASNPGPVSWWLNRIFVDPWFICFGRNYLTDESRVFVGDVPNPFCCHCSAQILPHSTIVIPPPDDPGDDSERLRSNRERHLCRFFAPAACSRCSYFPRLYGWNESSIVIPGLWHRPLNTYTELDKTKERDVSGPFANIVDSTHDYTIHHAWFTANIGTLTILQNTFGWFYRDWTWSYGYASRWVRDDPAGTAVTSMPQPWAGLGLGSIFSSMLSLCPALWPPVYGAVFQYLYPPDPPPEPPPPDPACLPWDPIQAVPLYCWLPEATFDPCGLLYRGPSPCPMFLATPPLPKPHPLMVLAYSLKRQATAGPKPTGLFSKPWARKVLKLSPPTTKSLSINAMRTLWNWTYANQTYPVQQLIAVDNASSRFLAEHSISTDPDLVRSPEVLLLLALANEKAAEQPATLRPPPGASAVATCDPAKTACIGSSVGNPTVVDHKHLETATCAMIKRMVPTIDPATGKPYFFNPESDTGKIFLQFMHVLKHTVFNDKSILFAYDMIMGGQTLEERRLAKFTEDEVKAFVTAAECFLMPSQIPPRNINGKLEMQAKDNKHLRFVYDNRLELMGITWLASQIFTELLVGHGPPDQLKLPRDPRAEVSGQPDPIPLGAGVFYGLSIKCRDRNSVLDNFSKTLSRDNLRPAGPTGGAGSSHSRFKLAAWEVDQTGMELHFRNPGTLKSIYELLARITWVIKGKLGALFTSLHFEKMHWDEEKGLGFVFNFPTGDKTKKKIFVSFCDIWMDSGWTLTSLGNFLGQLAAVFCSFTCNPWKLLARDHVGTQWTWRIHNPNFNWIFQSRDYWAERHLEPHPLCLNGQQSTQAKCVAAMQFIVVRGLFEGDDAAGAASRYMWSDRNRALFKTYMKEIGFEAKYDSVIEGRTEMIGAHFACVDGFIDPTIPWCPAFSRYADKFCVHVGPSTNATRCARLMSLADMFCGRIQPMAEAFDRLAEEFASKANHDELITVQIYTPEAVFLHGSYEFERVVATSDEISPSPKRRVAIAGARRAGAVTLDMFFKVRAARPEPVYPSTEIQIAMINNSVFGKPKPGGSTCLHAEGFSSLMLWSREVCTSNDAGALEAAYYLYPDALLKLVTYQHTGHAHLCTSIRKRAASLAGKVM